MKLSEIKNWDTKIENEITSKWMKSEMFSFNTKTKKKIYSIDTPPPYVNAPIHIGQAVTYCYMDFFARYKRMKGHEVIFPLGLDNNGLPIEVSAEKKFNVSPFLISRDEFISYCRKLLSEAGTETKDTFAKLGISFTSYKEGDHVGGVYETDSKKYRAITQSTFIDLYKKGLIYEDKRINNWDPKLRTTIADSEIEYKDIDSNFNYIKWKVKEGGEIIIGTTRPELISTCGMVIFNPEDERYKNLNGKTAISPIFEKEIPIRAHPLAQIDKGTGIVMMCSAGDLSDIQFFREMKLTPEIAIDIDGRMNERAGTLKGLKVREAREKIIEIIKERGLLVKQEKIIHRTPISERSGAEIEFIEMSEFYLKQVEFKKEIKNISSKINFYPKSAKKILDDWIESVSIDWPISRRRFYATPIPLWFSENQKFVVLGKEGIYHEPWKNNPSKDFEVYSNGKKIGKVGDEKFKKIKWASETRVMDTWMDSSISELVLLKYKQDDKFFKKSYPASLRPQGKEIIRTWLYYTLLRGYLATEKVSFEDVWINQHIVDSNGFKMSKSKGNVIDPQKLLKDYGAEAIRLWAATEGDLAVSDLKCSEERIRGELKTLNKLINISKFIIQFEKPKNKINLTNTDQIFINHIIKMTKDIDKDYSEYNFYRPSINLRKFLWDTFASNYIELVKNRAYNEEGNFSKEESESAKYTLHFLLERLITLIYPVIPQITSFIANEKGIGLLKIEWPKDEKIKSSDEELIRKLEEFNASVWKKKKEMGISLKAEIKNIDIPKELKIFERDLRACHRLV